MHERSDRDLIMAKPFQLATFLAVIRQLVATTGPRTADGV